MKINIRNKSIMLNIKVIAEKIGISKDNLELHGDFIGKIDYSNCRNLPEKGKLILVTAMTPTRFGEGKTTMSIGLADALNQLGKNTILCLREPSLGPVFSQKGGAAGGGKASVEPAQEINLHFTGDIHAITTVHNLIAAEIDNHIFWGNELKIKEVLWKRAIDLCDRSLRKEFMITAASEVMAVFCLALGHEDLKKRLENIVIGVKENDEQLRLSDLNISDKLSGLLSAALKPNLVQTNEGTPAFVHGGPFANIAHGTNSLIADKLALKLADYVVTEAGFGSELGAFKFFDIITRTGNIFPRAVVIVATNRAIKEVGIENIGRHVQIIRKLGVEPVVAINKFSADTDEDILKIQSYCGSINVKAAVSSAFSEGGKGSIGLAEAVLENIDEKKGINYIYDPDEGIKAKIEKVNQEIFGGSAVEFSEEANKKIQIFSNWGYGNLPVCIAKTQYSLSDDKSQPKILSGFKLEVTDLGLSAGAGFIVVYCGSILTMPGMPKRIK